MDSRKIVFHETGIVAIGEAVGVAVMLLIFALLQKFDSTVLLGGLVGGVLAVLNFMFMAITTSLAADKATEQNVKGGKALVQSSYFIRLAVLFLILFAFVKSGLCDPIASVVPLLFVRLTITVAEFFRKPGEANS